MCFTVFNGCHRFKITHEHRENIKQGSTCEHKKIRIKTNPLQCFIGIDCPDVLDRNPGPGEILYSCD